MILISSGLDRVHVFKPEWLTTWKPITAYYWIKVVIVFHPIVLIVTWASWAEHFNENGIEIKPSPRPNSLLVKFNLYILSPLNIPDFFSSRSMNYWEIKWKTGLTMLKKVAEITLEWILGNSSMSFCVILLTNRQTNENRTFWTEVINQNKQTQS